MNWSESVVFVTGAARGIGAETARRLHGLGARVALVGLEPRALKAVADSLGDDRALWLEVDVTDAEALNKAATTVQKRWGDINVLIANAGLLNLGSVCEGDTAAFDRTFQVNLNGEINSLRACAPQLMRRGGYVLNVASLAAINHGPGMAAYAASKAAVDALSDSARIELASRGVAVGCAYFGAIDTDLVQGSRQHPAMGVLERLAPRFIGAEIPVAKAADAIVTAIEKRKSRVWAPRWVQAAYALRGVSQPLLEYRLLLRPKSAKQTLGDALNLMDEQKAGSHHPLGTAANNLKDA